MTNDTPPPGPAAPKGRSAEEWAEEITRVGTVFDEDGYVGHDMLVIKFIVEEAMAQAHAAGRDGGLEAAITLLEVTRMGAVQGSQYPADMIRAAQAGMRALRTASAQPTATEASERDG